MEREQQEKWMKKIQELGASKTGLVPVSAIVFSLDFRGICETKACGMYGRCWTCPPYIGEAAQLVEDVRQFSTALVYQRMYPIEDSFDIEGMLEAGGAQSRLSRSIQHAFREQTGEKYLHLGAGGCRLCEVCTVLEEQPCRFPEDALASLEGYCINVSELAKSAGMQYINGQNTVTYFGALFFC